MKYIATCILCFIGFCGYSQGSWTLEECMAYGIEHNLELQQTQLTLEQSDIALRQSKNERYPSLSSNVSIGSNFGRTIDPVSNAFISQSFVSNSWGLSSGVVLFDAGRMRNSIRQAKRNKERTEFQLLQLKNDIALLIAQDYFNALMAKENIANIKAQMVSLDAQYENLKQLVNVGSKAEADLLDLEAQKALAYQNEITAQNQLRTTILQLKSDMMMPYDQELTVDLDATKYSIDDEMILSVEEIYKKAAQKQYALKAADAAVQSAEYDVKIAKAGYYPTVSFGVNAGTNYSNQSKQVDGFTSSIAEQTALINGETVTLGIQQATPNFKNTPYFDQLKNNLSAGLGLQVNIPIYDKGLASFGVQRARLNMESANIAKRREEMKLYQSVQKSYNDLAAAKARYDAANRALEAAKRLFENAELRYAIGNIDSFRYTDSKSKYDQQQINATVAKYQYLMAYYVLKFYANENLYN